MYKAYGGAGSWTMKLFQLEYVLSYNNSLIIMLTWNSWWQKALYSKRSLSRLALGKQLLHRHRRFWPALASSPLRSSSFWLEIRAMSSVLSSSLTLCSSSIWKGWTEDMFISLWSQENGTGDCRDHLTALPRLHCDVTDFFSNFMKN